MISLLISTLLAVAAPLSADGRVSFAVLSDLHIGDASSRQASDLRTCIADINAIQDSGSPLDFAIVSGDLTEFGTDSQICLVKSMLDSIQLPYYAIPGNHDAKWSESGCDTFGKVFGGESFEFEAGGFRFVGCASGPDMRMTPALIPRQHMNRLEELANDPCPTVFVNHYPLDTSVLNYGDVRALLKEMDARVVLSGHWHVNRTMDYSGMPGLVFRSTMSGKDTPAGYDIVSMEGGIMSARERDAESGRTGPVWVETDLRTAVECDADLVDGLPRDYPWMRYDENRKYPEIKEIWRNTESSNIATGFAFDGKRHAYYACETGRLVCIDVEDGRTVWETRLPGKVFSTPLYARGRVVIGCAAGGVYAFSARDGRQLWNASSSKSVLASPVRLGSRIFIGGSDGVFRAFNLRSGRMVWSHEGIESFVECRPWVDRKQLVFGSWGRRLYSLNPRNGSLQWVWEIDKGSVMYSPAACNPVKSNGRIFIAVPDRKLHVLDAATGVEIATAEGGREALGVSADGSRIYVKTMHSRAYSVDAASSPVDGVMPKAWDVRTCLGYDIAPTDLICRDGELLIPTDKGNVIALDAADGSFLWAHKISPALVNPMLVLPGGRLLVSTLDGILCLLQL